MNVWRFTRFSCGDSDTWLDSLILRRLESGAKPSVGNVSRPHLIKKRGWAGAFIFSLFPTFLSIFPIIKLSSLRDKLEVFVRITATKTCKTSDIHLSSIWLACVASVSVRFRSKERGTRVKVREKNGSRLISHAIKPKIPFHGLFLLRNQTETLATQATIW